MCVGNHMDSSAIIPNAQESMQYYIRLKNKTMEKLGVHTSSIASRNLFKWTCTLTSIKKNCSLMAGVMLQPVTWPPFRRFEREWLERTYTSPDSLANIKAWSGRRGEIACATAWKKQSLCTKERQQHSTMHCQNLAATLNDWGAANFIVQGVIIENLHWFWTYLVRPPWDLYWEGRAYMCMHVRACMHVHVRVHVCACVCACVCMWVGVHVHAWHKWITLSITLI